jgi:outer membrane immunogenic protein
MSLAESMGRIPMKKLLVAGIAAAALYSAPALAQPAPSVFNWTGAYIGVNGGGMDFTTKGDFAPFSTIETWSTKRKETGIIGLHGGFQGQWGNFVAGIEGGWDALPGAKYGSGPGTGMAGVGCSFATTEECQARINDILSVGPRVGFAMNQFMVYGTGGFARAMIDTRAVFSASGTVLSSTSNHQNGWYVGGGAEMVVINGFVVGVEFRHFDFSEKQQIDMVAPGFDRRIKANADAVLLRLTFGGASGGSRPTSSGWFRP